MFWTGLLHVTTAGSISGAAPGFRVILGPDCERSEFVSVEPHAGQGVSPVVPSVSRDLGTSNHGNAVWSWSELTPPKEVYQW